MLLKGQLSFLSAYYDVTAISGAGKDLDEVKEREAVKIHAISMERQISPLKDFVSLWKLYRYFKKEKPDIVHSITPKAGLLSMIAAKLAGVPVRMHTFTGLIFPTKRGVMQKLLILMDKILCYFATHIYPEGMGVKNDLIAYKITNKPLKVLANGNVNGIDSSFFDRSLFGDNDNKVLRSHLEIEADDFIFIFVGRLVGDKGINELIQAFTGLQAKVNERIPKLLLVGPLESKLDPLAPASMKEIEVNDGIISVGFQDDIRPYFTIADALVFPSYREGFPNVVLQAGAMELPAIVSNINGCNEIINEGENGLIIPVKEVQALKNAMLKLLNDQELYNKLKENARPRIVDNYEQSVVWQAILEEYRKAESNV